jgi:hypothetical protein
MQDTTVALCSPTPRPESALKTSVSDGFHIPAPNPNGITVESTLLWDIHAPSKYRSVQSAFILDEPVFCMYRVTLIVDADTLVELNPPYRMDERVLSSSILSFSLKATFASAHSEYASIIPVAATATKVTRRNPAAIELKPMLYPAP